jgi:hypothetical protein
MKWLPPYADPCPSYDHPRASQSSAGQLKWFSMHRMLARERTFNPLLSIPLLLLLINEIDDEFLEFDHSCLVQVLQLDVYLIGLHHFGQERLEA